MNSKSIPSWLGLFCGLFLVIITFYYFPILGHDYSLAIPSFVEMRLAFTQYGVINPQFSSMKCLGLPIWANPSTITFSLVHFLLLIFSDLSALSIFIFLVGYFSFYGCYQLSKKLQVSELGSLYLATGWTLQGWMIMRVMVGHITYLSFGLLPLIVLLFLKQGSKLKEVAAGAALVLILSQFVFFPAAYLPFFMVFSFIFVIPLLLIWKRELNLSFDFSYLLKKGALVFLFSLVLVLPKLLAISDLMKNFPREESFLKIGFLSALPYSVLNLFSFLPHDFEAIVGWPYGNWESIQFIYPLFLIYASVSLIGSKKKNELKKLAITLLYLIFISALFASGALSDVFSQLPFLKSMHVNPRWNITILFSVYLLSVALLRHLTQQKWVWMGLGILAITAPLLHLDQKNLKINYPYRAAYEEKTNRLLYCYEPWLGYHLEQFPKNGQSSINWATDPYRDPRCYISSQNCKPGTMLKAEDIQALESYHLKKGSE